MIQSVLILDSSTRVVINRVSIDSERPETLNLQPGQELASKHDGDIGWTLTESGEWINPNPPTPRDQAVWARHIRSRLLEKSDKYMVLDYPITDQAREQWRQYRQALRDITQQPGFPDTIEWPVQPE